MSPRPIQVRPLPLFLAVVLALGAAVAGAAEANAAPAQKPRLTDARTADGKSFISWKEHRIDDSGLAGIRPRGADDA